MVFTFPKFLCLNCGYNLQEIDRTWFDVTFCPNWMLTFCQKSAQTNIFVKPFLLLYEKQSALLNAI